LTVDTSENQGQLLHRKMLRFIKAKCHPILIDSNINSPTIIRLNIYQNFMFSAIRFHSYIKSINKVTPLRKQNPQFLLNIILDIINYMNVVVKSCVTSPIGKKMGCVCELTEVEIKCLGLRAFLTILSKKPSKYSSIITTLRHELHTEKMQNLVVTLSPVFCSDASPMFKKMKF